MKEFKVNDYFSLRLEDDKTIIYVKGKRFDQCKQLVLNITVEEVSIFNEIESIDEVIKVLNVQERVEEILITPETEFWAHCSNLQVWAENNYDTNLIHSNLAFPLLKELVKVGDLKAQKIFSEEIAKRIEKNYFPVIQYLINEGFLDYLNNSQFLNLIESSYIDIPQLIEKYDESERSHERSFKIYKLFDKLKVLPPEQYPKILKKLYKTGKYDVYHYLDQKGYSEVIGRKQYYYCLLEERDAEIMLELERLLEGEFWIGVDIFDDMGAAIMIENRRVTEMNISIEGLERFLKPIIGLKKLRKLYYYGPIASLPEDINKLKNLEELILIDNKLKRLPDSMGKLRSLRILDLSGNPIKFLPKSLRNSCSLEKLLVDYNPEDL